MSIETLLITGQNNHDWARSAPFCRDVLQNSGRFNVLLTEDPEEQLRDKETLSKYQLLFVDYNGPAWDDVSKQNFLDAVRGGSGVCILHAADNAFDGWKEYEEICSDEVDRVVETLDSLIENTQSENIKHILEEASSNVYYLVYEDEDEEGGLEQAA